MVALLYCCFTIVDYATNYDDKYYYVRFHKECSVEANRCAMLCNAVE